MEQLVGQTIIRKCPRCKVLVHKEGGCLKVNCPNCNYNFCWSCMGSAGKGHGKCLRFCPEFQFSMIANITLTVFILGTLPILLLLGTFFYVCFIVSYWGIEIPYDKFNACGVPKCISGLLALVICLALVFPLSLVIAAILTCLIVVFGTIPLYFCFMCYFVRLTTYYIRHGACG